MNFQVAAVAALLILLAPAPTLAAAPGTEGLFREGVAALERGSHDDAIDRFELLADRGVQHPDASYDRAVAYVARVRATGGRPGDLGRAAAGFAEALELDPSDMAAEQALQTVREEIARRRARAGDQPVRARPALSRAVLDLLPEGGWAILAAAGSLLCALGLGLRLFSQARRPRLVGDIVGGLGGAALLIGGAALAMATRMHVNARPAVVVVPEARLLNAAGVPVAAKGGDPGAIPEGESVFVREQVGATHRVEWGSVEGYVSAGQLRFLARDRQMN
ncbi:MAG: hypothetical protein R3B13_02545 [Polyangiaceae bacterium]